MNATTVPVALTSSTVPTSSTVGTSSTVPTVGSPFNPTWITAVVAFVALIVAWRQWWTARQNLRLGLFKSRFAVYAASLNLLEVCQDNIGGELDKVLDATGPAIDDFMRCSLEARFLFKKETCNYIMGIRKLTGELRGIIRRIHRLNEKTKTFKSSEDNEQHLQLLREDNNLTARISEYGKDFDIYFNEYLDFRNIGLRGPIERRLHQLMKIVGR